MPTQHFNYYLFQFSNFLILNIEKIIIKMAIEHAEFVGDMAEGVLMSPSRIQSKSSSDESMELYLN